MKVLATYTCEEHDITHCSDEQDITGKVLFINGMLAHVLNSKQGKLMHTPISKTPYWIHKVLCFEHITNA